MTIELEAEAIPLMEAVTLAVGIVNQYQIEGWGTAVAIHAVIGALLQGEGRIITLPTGATEDPVAARGIGGGIQDTPAGGQITLLVLRR